MHTHMYTYACAYTRPSLSETLEGHQGIINSPKALAEMDLEQQLCSWAVLCGALMLQGNNSIISLFNKVNNSTEQHKESQLVFTEIINVYDLCKLHVSQRIIHRLSLCYNTLLRSVTNEERQVFDLIEP